MRLWGRAVRAEIIFTTARDTLVEEPTVMGGW